MFHKLCERTGRLDLNGKLENSRVDLRILCGLLFENEVTVVTLKQTVKSATVLFILLLEKIRVCLIFRA